MLIYNYWILNNGKVHRTWDTYYGFKYILLKTILTRKIERKENQVTTFVATQHQELVHIPDAAILFKPAEKDTICIVR